MRAARLLALFCVVLPAAAAAGPQYSADDIIRFFKRSNAEAPAPAPARAISTGTAAAEQPLAIPMTGAKAGHGVAASGASAGGDQYDLLITFEMDSATLTPQARQNLEAFAQALGDPALAGARFAVEGHTDASGPAGHNLALSRRRAVSVVDYLVARGVDARRLAAAGYGETRPRAADPQHPDNRRVETRRLQ